jgi:hypothetical protein
MNTKNNITYLQPKYDTRKSFYNKAYYTTEEINNTIIYKLYSYNTLVLIFEIDKNFNSFYNTKVIRYYLDNNKKDDKNFYSNTTLRHIKEFIKQTIDNINTYLQYQNYSIVYYKNVNLA